jgi:hypothetical protein
VFDNEGGKVWSLCLDQYVSLQHQTGVKSSVRLGHLHKYYEKKGLKQFSDKHAQNGSNSDFSKK